MLYFVRPVMLLTMGLLDNDDGSNVRVRVYRACQPGETDSVPSQSGCQTLVLDRTHQPLGNNAFERIQFGLADTIRVEVRIHRCNCH